MYEEVVILRARRIDVPELMGICEEHAAFERLPHAPDVRADVLAEALEGSPPPLYAWLARADGDLVGYASATTDFSTLDRCVYLHMDCLYVRAQWRNRAIGQQLLAYVQDHAAALGCASIQWQTPSWNERAARFYRRIGASESVKLRYALSLPLGA
jgi:GNAT superfamily N-acetyltransferase